MAHEEKKHAKPTTEVEQPKEKVGDKPAATTVDKPAKERKPRAVKGIGSYRILDGVDAAKFNGQRKVVVLTMQKLSASNPEGSFTVAEIVAAQEGLVTRDTLENSVEYHV